MTAAKALVSEWNRMGSQMRFFVGTLAGIPDASCTTAASCCG